ncbi:hypothetical protein CMU69_14745 [Elizabethkingia anophelis]|nr:hypothetical protein [Elizabethkingia anophelis]
MKDYYKILEISATASLDEIQSAYRNASRKWHPDRNSGMDTTSQMQEINEAYRILKDEESRKRYDDEYNRFYRLFEGNTQGSDNENKKERTKKNVKWKFEIEYALYIIGFSIIIFIIVNGCEKVEPVKTLLPSADTINLSSTHTRPELNNVDTLNTTINKINDSINLSMPIAETKTYYCVAVFYLKSKQPRLTYIGDRSYEEYDYSIKISEVFETTNIAEDNKYKILDSYENTAMKYEMNNVIRSRDIEYFENYADASKRRQELLGRN